MGLHRIVWKPNYYFGRMEYLFLKMLHAAFVMTVLQKEHAEIWKEVTWLRLLVLQSVAQVFCSLGNWLWLGQANVS